MSEQTISKPEPKKKERFFDWMNKPSFRYIVVLVVVVVAVGLMSASVYTLPPTNSLVRVISGALPYPAASVNGELISMDEYLIERDAVSFFLAQQELQTPLTEEEIHERIMSTLIDKVIVEQIAKDYQVSLDQARVDELIEESYLEAGSEEIFLEEIKTMFGWELPEFSARVIAPVVLSFQVNEVLRDDTVLQKEAFEKITSARERIVSGEEFSIVATELGEDFAATLGGDIGVIPFTALVLPELRSFVENADIEELSGVIDLPEAYALVKVSEREEENPTEAHVHIIVVQKAGLDLLIKNTTESSKIKTFLRI